MLLSLLLGALGAGAVGAPPASSRGWAVRGLSAAQLAGQRIVYSYAGLTPPAQLLALIRQGEAAGVIFFPTNVTSVSQLRAVTTELQAANEAGPVRAPLLLMADQEGGLVRSVPGGPVLSEAAIGASPNAQAAAAEAGTEAGASLTSAGLNVDLAPVADVARQPFGFDALLQRSYGTSAPLDAALTGAFVGALQGTGVAATAKHFPGLGAAWAFQDTDLFGVVLDPPLETLRTIDEAPFQAAIAARVRLVMVSWATYPALDPWLPAGLSPAVIGGELRGRLGFDGVTITDGIGAGALWPFGDDGERGLLAASAGADLVLCSTPDPFQDGPQIGESVLSAIAGALADGRLDRAGADASVTRVLALRRALGDASDGPDELDQAGVPPARVAPPERQ